ncbi:MAG TPA: MFS transporter [Pseudolabrys sp.]|jgi:MFS family permease|nr:MFS transporter [Pseudolabrys sp.]
MTIQSPQLAVNAAASPIPRAAWLALVSGFLGWTFDSMDLNLFSLVVFPTLAELLGTRDPVVISETSGLIVALKILAWGTGGIVFGVVADRVGRSKTLALTILIYSVFTGLSGLAQNWWQLAIFQAIAGIGIGGEWAAGGALIAETWPERYRARAMLIMQMGWSFGFFAAALVNFCLTPISWRWALAAGLLPAIVTLFVRQFVPEPERWRNVRKNAAIVGDTAWDTFATIFKPGMARRTIVGVCIAAAMMIGSFPGLALIGPWVNKILGPGHGGEAIRHISYTFFLINLGAIFGYLAVMWLSDAIGRRLTYFVFCVAALAITWITFRNGSTVARLEMLAPVYGFITVGGFGTFAIYLPELFPTRVRVTGQGFSYNMSRVLTAPWPYVAGILVGTFGSIPSAVCAVASLLAVGMIAIWFGPETRGTPLID